MANQSQTLYLQDTIQLADTLVIKYEAAARAMNTYYLEYHKVDFSDEPLSKWPYYRNLAGQYVTGYDTTMRVISLDTLEEIDFTYENLQVHRATAAAYTIGSEYYRALVRRYVNQELLIQGIINPTPIAKSTAAPNFTILNWDSRYVEPQETNLLAELQIRIDAFALRWYQPRWEISQSLYAGGFWVQLTFAIIQDILNIRLANCGTRFVHSYHIWGYLGSFMRLDRWQAYLTQAQAMWLYRNIAVIVNNAGKTGTFDSLVENLLTARGIPLTKHEVWHDTSGIPDSVFPVAQMAKIPLNNFANTQDGTVAMTTIDDVLERELPLARDNRIFIDNVRKVLPVRARSSYVNQLPTKVLESQMVDRTENVPLKLSATVYNSWVWMTMHDRYVAEITITDPGTGAVLGLSPKDAIILWVYCSSKEYGITLTDIPPIMVHNVMRPMMPSYEELRSVVPDEYISREDILVAIDAYAAPGRIISREAFKQYCHAAYSATFKYRQLVAFCEDPRRRGYMEGMCNRFYLNERVSLVDTPTTYEAWFASRNIDFSAISDERLAEFGEDLYVNATGTDLKDVTAVKEIQAASIGIMTQLSSYSVQYIREINEGPFETANNIAPRFGTRGESGAERWRVPYDIRFETAGEKDRLAEFIDVGRVFNSDSIGIVEHDRMAWGRPLQFKQRGGDREHVRILVPAVSFSAYLGPGIDELCDVHFLGGIMPLAFIDPSIVPVLDTHYQAGIPLVQFDPIEIPDTTGQILREDGTPIVLESGFIMLLETMDEPQPPFDRAIIMESGTVIVWEDGRTMQLEDPAVEAMVSESGVVLLWEDGRTMQLEV